MVLEGWVPEATYKSSNFMQALLKNEKLFTSCLPTPMFSRAAYLV